MPRQRVWGIDRHTGFTEEPSILDQDRYDTIKHDEAACDTRVLAKMRSCPEPPSRARVMIPAQSPGSRTQDGHNDVQLADIELRHVEGGGQRAKKLG